MLLRVDKNFSEKKASGIFLTYKHEEKQEIGGYTPKYKPIISKLWSIFGLDFDISKRGGMRLAIEPSELCVYVRCYTRNISTDRLDIDLDSCNMINATLSVYGNEDCIIPLTIACMRLDTKCAYVVFGTGVYREYVVINETLGECLDEIGLCEWDIGLSHCKYEYVRTWTKVSVEVK